ncbi:MAG: prepilin-type N-terminal cleavage/methylation domain-containing protein [Sedimentisphaerales bacterium]|nr:prepilin-type N-terminal cleavage/methylation domain-containing protein [Sedimentisphaerales bacterium]
MQANKHNRGFTFIEVLIATILIGLAIASLMAANRAFTTANDAGTDLSTAEFLIEQIKELTALLPVVEPGTPESADDVFGPESGETQATYDDLNDFDGTAGNGTIFSPPINANRNVLNDYATFSQQVTVENVSATNFEQVVDPLRSSFVRVTVSVSQNGQMVTSTSWLRARY